MNDEFHTEVPPVPFVKAEKTIERTTMSFDGLQGLDEWIAHRIDTGRQAPESIYVDPKTFVQLRVSARAYTRSTITTNHTATSFELYGVKIKLGRSNR